MNNNPFFKPTLYWITALYILLTFPVLMLGDQVASYMFSEDNYFENVGALSFFAASFLFFYAFIRSRSPHNIPRIFRLKQLVYLGFAFLFFFGGGEEISWGQRIFNLQTPEALSAVNAQQELNVHNIDFFEYKFSFELFFDILWLVLTVLLPITSLYIKPFERFVGRFVPIVHWGIGLLFVFNYLLAKVARAVFVNFYTYSLVPFVQAVQETKESNYSLLFVLVALFVVWDFNKLRNENANE